jgi:hypothetical protein
MPVVTGIDVLGVQRYVFASNRLRDAVAASWLVDRATTVDGILDLPGRGEVLMAAGGNAILTFADWHQAGDFVARYTRWLHDEAPGLEVAVAHHEYDPEGLARALKVLQTKMARMKLEREPSAPQLGLSVTMPCRITGLPATGFDPQDSEVPLARSILRFRDERVRRGALRRWDDFLQGYDGLVFPLELDDLGRTREDTSLIGWVHIDGNGVGQKINDWLSDCIHNGITDAQLRQQFRAWSTALSEVGQNAFHAVVRRVIQAIDPEKGQITGQVPQLGFDLQRDEGKRLYLPIRPVLLGGDDLTFICDGRLALDLAETALGVFEAQEVPHLGRISACAGIAIVRSHAPFERAYELSAALCASAKRRRQQKEDKGSWLDWHIGSPRPGEGLADLRARAYCSQAGDQRLELTCRPYQLGVSADATETWRWLSHTVIGTTGNGLRAPGWRQHRNKVKQLAAVLREGPNGIRLERTAWTAAAPLQLPGRLDANNGFPDGRRTPLLDAIELLDLHLPLGGGESA